MTRCRMLRLLLVTVILVLGFTPWFPEKMARAQGGRDANLEYGPAKALSQILGRPTGDSVALSVLSASDIEAYVEFGHKKGDYSRKTGAARSNAGSPFGFGFIRILRTCPQGRRAFSEQRGVLLWGLSVGGCAAVGMGRLDAAGTDSRLQD